MMFFGLLGEIVSSRPLCTSSARSIIKSSSTRPAPSSGPFTVLGIESTFDDSAAAVVRLARDGHVTILGESLLSQIETHALSGGLVPRVAEKLHATNLFTVVTETLTRSGLRIGDVDAIAVSSEPGMGLCLKQGLRFAKSLALEHGKPLIPVHHMRAHALTARLTDQRLVMPYLVLLISGGHCLLCWASTVDNFAILGSTTDNAPGEVLDKITRRLIGKQGSDWPDVPATNGLPWAAVLEALSNRYHPAPGNYVTFPVPLAKYRDCNFSWAGFGSAVTRFIDSYPDCIGFEEACRIAASAYRVVVTHLLVRTQRAMRFVASAGYLDNCSNPTLVVSGGVARNDLIRSAIQRLCVANDYRPVFPEPKLCSDNGIMIAWNGIEYLRLGHPGLRGAQEINSLRYAQRSPIGGDMSQLVTDSKIHVASK